MARRTRSPRESRSIETTGRTIDEAVAKASAQLKVSEHDLEIKVIEEGRGGFLGIGSKEARIRATVKGGGVVGGGPRTPREEGRREDVRREDSRRPRRAEGSSPAPDRGEERPPLAEGDDSDARRRRNRRGRRGREGDDGGLRTETRENRDSRGSREGRERRERRPAGDRSGGVRMRRESTGPGAGVPAQPDTDFEARAKDLLSGILERMGFPTAVDSRFDEGAYLLTIQGGDDEAVLIGRKGETLDALQHIVYKTVSRGREDSLSVRIDVAGYRERREEALADEARELAAKALAEGRSQQTEPLRPAERRIVHRAITEMDGVTSRAIGNGVVKRILIEAEGSVSENEEPLERTERAPRRPESGRAPRPAPSAASTEEVLDYVSSEPAPENRNKESETNNQDWGRKARPSKKLRGRR